jgi:hypothetical protein
VPDPVVVLLGRRPGVTPVRVTGMGWVVATLPGAILAGINPVG